MKYSKRNLVSQTIKKLTPERIFKHTKILILRIFIKLCHFSKSESENLLYFRCYNDGSMNNS